MKILLRFIGIITVLLLIQSCQYNDICPGDTPGTPRLLIQFFDNQRPGLIKPVEGFNAKVVGDTAYYFAAPINDSVAALPLRTDRKKTTYELVLHQDDSTRIKRDTITFTYTPEDAFISRACGFKSVFTNLGVEWTPTQNGWIGNRRIADTTKQIKNERKASLYIYH